MGQPVCAAQPGNLALRLFFKLPVESLHHPICLRILGGCHLMVDAQQPANPSDHMEDENHGPLSDVMVEGTWNLAIHPENKASAQPAVIVPFNVERPGPSGFSCP
jgi:hypothetical protein